MLRHLPGLDLTRGRPACARPANTVSAAHGREYRTASAPSRSHREIYWLSLLSGAPRPAAGTASTSCPVGRRRSRGVGAQQRSGDEIPAAWHCASGVLPAADPVPLPSPRSRCAGALPTGRAPLAATPAAPCPVAPGTYTQTYFAPLTNRVRRRVREPSPLTGRGCRNGSARRECTAGVAYGEHRRASAARASRSWLEVRAPRVMRVGRGGDGPVWQAGGRGRGRYGAQGDRAQAVADRGGVGWARRRRGRGGGPRGAEAVGGSR